MKTFEVVKYYEAYETYLVKAKTAAEAKSLVFRGNAGDPYDVTVKESDILSANEVVDNP